MKRRTRSTDASSSSSVHRYLKPGALARIRDSKITTRSHRVHTVMTTSFNRPPSSLPVPGSPSANHVHIDTSPCFSGRMCYGYATYAPRFLQRKKLVAARSISYLVPASPAAVEIGDSAGVDAFGTDVAAQ